MPPELNHLRSFVTIARFGHLTRAADALHLSQPALSGHVKQLEEELGVTLFERTPSGMSPTPAGARLAVEAEGILDAVAQLVQKARSLAGQPTGHLAVGTLLDPGVLRVGELLVRALERYPQVEIELQQVMTNDALVRLRNGTLDASFYLGPEPEADLVAVPLRELRYCVALPGDWAAELGDAPWEVLADRPWIVAPERTTHRRMVMDLFGGEPPPRTIHADSESVINNLVESGVGISLVRDESCADAVDAGRIALWKRSEVTTQLWLVYAASRSGDTLLQALCAVLHDVW